MSHSTRRRAAIRDLGDGRVGIWAAFEHKDRLKDLPSARWDPNLKCWHVDALFRREAEALLAEINGAAAGGDLVDAIATLINLLPVALRQPTYRALAKAWHPDAGGDGPAMQALNEAGSRKEDLL